MKMHAMQKIQTQQVGLRLPTYLVDEVDEFIKDFNVNRTTFIAEAISNFLKQQKEKEVHARLGKAMQEVRLMMDGKIPAISARDTIEELKDELKNKTGKTFANVDELFADLDN